MYSFRTCTFGIAKKNQWKISCQGQQKVQFEGMIWAMLSIISPLKKLIRDPYHHTPSWSASVPEKCVPCILIDVQEVKCSTDRKGLALSVRAYVENDAMYEVTSNPNGAVPCDQIILSPLTCHWGKMTTVCGTVSFAFNFEGTQWGHWKRIKAVQSKRNRS